MADYLVRLSAELPYIVGHVETPARQSDLGAKGAGEAGIAAALGAQMNAINDARRLFKARVTTQRFTPQRVLEALGKIWRLYRQRLFREIVIATNGLI
jgi:carbon-monoxide dehydrogenase large subunit